MVREIGVKLYVSIYLIIRHMEVKTQQLVSFKMNESFKWTMRTDSPFSKSFVQWIVHERIVQNELIVRIDSSYSNWLKKKKIQMCTVGCYIPDSFFAGS